MAKPKKFLSNNDLLVMLKKKIDQFAPETDE